MVYKDEYGHNAGDDKQASFKRGILTADIPGNSRAHRLNCGYAGTFGDAMLVVNDMIPSDSVQLNSSAGKEKMLSSYSSEMLNSILGLRGLIAGLTYTNVDGEAIVEHISIAPGSDSKLKQQHSLI